MSIQNDYPPTNGLLGKNLIQQTTPEIKRKVLEYGRLSQIVHPSPEEEQKLDQILSEAIDDALLNFWIEHVDHVLAHYYGLLTDEARESYRSQGAVLKELIDPDLCSLDKNSEDRWTDETQPDQEVTPLRC